MSTARPILIVEDDGALRHALVDHLTASGEFQPAQAATLGEATRHLGAANARFDLIILEVDLPDGHGRDFCAHIRQQGHKMPIIMLTGAFENADVVRGLDAGANDYVSKPFRPSELMARLRTQLRFFDNSEEAVFTIGSSTFRPSAKLLVKSGKNQCIRLTGKEAAVLKLLYRTGNRGATQGPAERSVGLQRWCHDTHAGKPHLHATPENRGRSEQLPLIDLDA